MHENLKMVVRVARSLGELSQQVVFVGGATVPLFLTDAGAAPPRFTKDVDVIVELTTRASYHRFGEQLRLCGFREDVGKRGFVSLEMGKPDCGCDAPCLGNFGF